MRPVAVPAAWAFLLLGAVTLANAIRGMRGPAGAEWLDWAGMVLSVLMLALGAGSLMVHLRRRRRDPGQDTQ